MAGTIFTVAEFNRAQALVAKMLGVGEGDYGYNQSTINSTQANPEFTVSDAIALRKDILMLTYHQVGPTYLSTQPKISIPEITNNQLTAAISDKILFATLGARLPDLSLPSTPKGWLLDGRTNMYQKSRAIRNTIRTITMTEDWNSTSTHTFTVTFEDADAMRCYFNAGSTIEITPIKSGTTSTQNSKWVTLFASVGILTFQRHSTAVQKTNITTKLPGYTTLAQSAAAAASASAVDNGIIIFKTSTTFITYTVTAVISGTNSIIFTSTFSNNGPNVTGVLTTTVKSYHAVRLDGDDPLQYIDIPEPSCDSSYIIGAPNPSFSITRTPTLSQLNETGKSNNIAYTFYATNFTGDTVYYTIVKDVISKPPSASDIIIEDFIDRPLSAALTLGTTGSSKSVTLNITIAADATTEGLDKFDIEFRATDDTADLVLISVKSAFGKTVNISDTSPTPKVLARTLRFGAVTTGKIPTYTVGTKVEFSIISTNVFVPNNLVTWKIRTVTGTARDLTADDFQEGLEGDFNMPADQKYNLELNIEDDAKFDALEKFIVDLYLSDPDSKEVLAKPAASSYVVQITSTVEVVQAPYAVLPPSALTMEENGKVGISIPFTTPYLAPTAAKVWYWITAADSGNGISTNNKIEATDFTDKTIKGVCPVTVKGNAGSGTLKKIAAADSAIEGTEGFIVTFYKDKDYTASFGETAPIRITETVGYTVDVSSRSMREPLPTGTTSTGKLPKSITFTLKTPYIENDPATSVHWEVMAVDPAPSGGIGIFTADDFEEGIEGDKPVVDNKVVLTLTASNDGMTEGVEQFYVRFTLTVNDVAITKDSPIVSVTEVVAYTIAKQENSPSTVNEQPTGTTQGFEYVIKTPYLPPNTPIYWEVIPADKTSVLEKTDFTIGQYSGQIIINQNGVITNEATLSLVPVVDTKIEGSESFHVIVKTSPSKTSEVARTLQSSISTINEDFKPSIYVASKSLTEGATGLNFNITVPKTNVGTKVYWKITKGAKGTITPSDFSVTDAEGKNRQATSGHVLTTKTNTAVLSIAARQDAVANSSTNTEDEEKFTVSIGMSASADEATTEELSITDISSYIVTTDVTSVVETEGSLLGSKSRTVNFNVYTPFFPEGHTLYYTVKSVAGTVNSADFISGTPAQDTFNVYNNYHKLAFTMKDDKSTAEGNEKFYIEIRETGYTSPVVKGGVSPGVLIYDTSVNNGTPIDDTEITATITSLDNKMEYTEGDTMNLRITTEGVLTSDDLNWSILSYVSGGIGQYLSAVESAAPFRVTGSITAGSITLPPITVTITAPNEGYRVFIFQVHKGSVATDPIGFAPFAIKDKVAYSVEPTGTLISESGNTGTTFNVITPLDSYSSTLKWQIVPESGSTVTGNDFNVPSTYNFDGLTMTGTVAINPFGKGSFTLTAANDTVVEDIEKFRIKLQKPVTGGGYEPIPNVQSSIVNISDFTNYTLTWTADGKVNNTVPAGNTVTYTLTTPKLVASSMLSPWAVNKTGDASAVTVITPASIIVNETTTSYTFTLATSSSITSNLSFNVDIVKLNGFKVIPVTLPPSVTLIAPPVYKITATKQGSAATTISETDTLTVNVQSSTTPIYWYIAQDRSDEATTAAIDSNDFASLQILAGTLNLGTAKTKSFDLIFANLQNRKDGTKRFHLFLSSTAPTTPLQSPLPAPISGAETVTITKTQEQVYTIKANNDTVAEGSPVEFTVTTPNIGNVDLTYKWEVVPVVPGSITDVTSAPTKTTALTGDFTINAVNKTGTVTITVPVSTGTASRQYQLKIFNNLNTVVIPITATGNPIITVTKTPVSTYTITASPNTNTVAEGSPVTFTVTASIANTTGSYKWEVVPVTPSIITAVISLPVSTTTVALTGNFTMTKTGNAGSGTVTITVPVSTGTTSRQYQLKISDNIANSVVIPITATGNPIITVTKNEYTITASPNPVAEGSPVEFTVTSSTLGTTGTSTYYWRVVPVVGSITAVISLPVSTTDVALNGDFVMTAKTKKGTVKITVPVTVLEDIRTYQLEISDNLHNVVIPVTDTTKNPIITVKSNTYEILAYATSTSTTAITEVMEGSLITFKVTKSSTSTLTKITWSVIAASTTPASTFVAATHVTVSTGASTFDTNGICSFTVTTKIDPQEFTNRKNNANRKFRIALSDTAGLLTNTTQSDITITDYEYLSVTDNGVTLPGGNSPVIREGTSGTGADAQLPNNVTFTVIAKPTDLNTALNYEITGTADVKPEKFQGTPPLKGTTANVTLNSTVQYAGLYTVDFTLTTVADSITNNPTNKTFSVKFTRSGFDTGSAATNACTSRTISIKDTSTTFIPAAYLITDTGFPQIGTVLINEGNVITFTVHVRDTDIGSMYYSIRSVSGKSIKPAHLIKAGETVPLTSLQGSVPIIAGYATLTLTTVLDNAINTNSKGFNVMFSRTELTATSTQSDKNLISRSVTVVDTSKPDVVVPTITHTLSETPPGCFVLPNGPFYVESKITPITAPTSMTWRISGDAAVLKKIKYNSAYVNTNIYTATSSPKNRSGATVANCHFLSLAFTVDNVLDTEDVCGLFTVTLSASQPSGDITVSADINLIHLAKPVFINSNGPFPLKYEDIKVQGIEYFVVTLAGARGANGNQRGASWDAGYGAPGDIVTGIIPANTQIYFNFFSGGPGGISRASWTMPPGGNGGDGVAVYAGPRLPVAVPQQPPHATAAGGGGGGSGWADSTSVTGSTGISPTVTAVYSSSNVATAHIPNDGNGGSGGGTVSYETQGIADNNNDRGYRRGGPGGVSFVPATWYRKAGANASQSAYASVAIAKKCSSQTNQPLQFIDAGTRDVIVPAGMYAADLILVGAGGGGGGAGGTPISVSNVTYPTAEPFITNLYDYSGYNRFGIYGGPNTLTTDKAPVLATINKTLTLMTFRTPFLAPPKLTSYTLFYHGRGTGSVVIDRKTYSFTGTNNLQAQTVKLSSTFSRLITVSATLTNTLYKLVSGSYVSPGIGSGSVGINALFDVTITATGYSVAVSSGNGGSKYTTGEQLKILGTSVGGSTPANDILFYVTAVDSKGKITKIGPPLAGYGTAAKPYGIAAWLVPEGCNKLYDPAIHPESWLDTDTNGKYKESDILWSTRMPCSFVIDNAGKSNGSSGAGGGAGSIVSTRIQVTPGETLVISVGAGGAGGLAQDHDIAATHSTAGSAGAATTLSRNSTVIATANGGAGGGTFTYVTPPVAAAIPGAAGGDGIVATGLTNNGSVGTSGVKGIVTSSNTVGGAKGGLGGNNLSSYGKGSPGGAIDESTQDTFFTDGGQGADGYICIAWRPDPSMTDYSCNVKSAVVSVQSISNVVMKCSHYPYGEGNIQITFNDARWSTNVASYKIWYTSAGLGAGYPTTEYFLTEILNVNTLKTGTGVASTLRTNVWVTTFTNGSSNLTNGTLRIQALSSTGAVLYFKTLTRSFVTADFIVTNNITYTYNFAYLSSDDTATVPANLPAPSASGYTTGSYIAKITTDTTLSYWVVPKTDWDTQPYIPKLYWEDLNIPVTPGMTIRGFVHGSQAGYITLTNQNGVTWTYVTTGTTYGVDAPFPNTLNTSAIVKIEFEAGQYGYCAADIKNSAGTVVWNTQNPWKHSV